MQDISIYQGPLQGFTDYIYRKAYVQHFKGIDKYFIPYIHLDKHKELSRKFAREIAKENNRQELVVPQVLTKSSSELTQLSSHLASLGYNELNLNMGCPYPMVALKGKGSGQLKDVESFKQLMDDYFSKQGLKLSLKLRLGYEESDEIFTILEIANDYPITELIIHPRIGKQLYKGSVDLDRFEQCLGISKHTVVYNGDIDSIDAFQLFRKRFPEINSIMIGRGLLHNPFLPEELKLGESVNHSIRQHRIIGFHTSILGSFSVETDPTNLLNKMKQFWLYYASLFKDAHKVRKQIKKLKSMSHYEDAVTEIFVKQL